MKGKNIRLLRYAVQYWFLLFCIYIGYRFYLFVRHFETGGVSPFVSRPPSVEGFLPIAGFMSFKYFVLTGIIEPIHPAALFLFMAAVAVSLFFKKGFCGWICPVGTVSQSLWMAGERITGRNFRLPRWVDIPLRAVKYLAMGFFLVMIGLIIRTSMMVLFFITDYYKIVDVRTMKFFTEMSTATAVFLVVVGLMSIFYKNVWCRYLCPYGALLELVSKLSPARIRRNKKACINCGSCSKHCPALIDVQHSESVSSAECFGCLTCVSYCKGEGALQMTVKIPKKGIRSVRPVFYVVALLIVFYSFVFVAKVTNHWASGVSYQEYMKLLSKQGPTQREHPRLP
ncbi:MAG: 4Fe-4S binding protein [Nitrospirae bacterium]|nr:MAG: 4Fe-4S binding protein [Nitrospirota bacterium]